VWLLALSGEVNRKSKGLSAGTAFVQQRDAFVALRAQLLQVEVARRRGEHRLETAVLRALFFSYFKIDTVLDLFNADVPRSSVFSTGFQPPRHCAIALRVERLPIGSYQGIFNIGTFFRANKLRSAYRNPWGLRGYFARADCQVMMPQAKCSIAK
jgi:hypothetical protein